MRRALASLYVACLFLAGTFMLGAVEARAAVVEQSCHRFEPSQTTFGKVVSDEQGWTCSDDDWRSSERTTWLRFDIPETGIGRVEHLTMRLAGFDTLTLFAETTDGSVSKSIFPFEQLRPLGDGPFAAVALPRGDFARLYVRIDNPVVHGIGSHARLVDDLSEGSWPPGLTLLVAAVFGLVIAPLVVNLVLYPVLRKPFMLWHAGMAAGMLVCLAMATGLAAAFLPVSVSDLVTGLIVGYVLIVGCAGFFAATFLEEDALTPAVRKTLYGAALLLFVVGGGIALEVPVLRRAGHDFYLLAFFPMLFATLAAMAQGFARGSIWVRYQIVGWAPAIIVGLDIVATGLGLQGRAQLGAAAPFLAMGFEVVVTAIGVGHRLLRVRRERDTALAEAKAMEVLSERDPLTGLLNRRAMDARFDDLHRAGYETFAILDLDHFKRVNDNAGHAVGDDVLRVAANVLDSDTESIAMRLGGEEFLLLLRGRDAAERAEKLRCAVPVRIAREVPGLDSIVTASMGLVVIPRGAMPKAGFTDIYAHADRLLYEAKEQGRNRAVSEKVRGFRRQQDRRKRVA